MVVKLRDTAVGWKSSTQECECVTIATCEFKYFALCDASEGAFLIRAILLFLQPERTGMRMEIFGDNEGANMIMDTPK